MTSSTFQHKFKKFKANIPAALKNVNTGYSCNLLESFLPFWNCQEVRKHFSLPSGDPNINRKGQVESEKFREHGNRLYKAKLFEKALLAYNYSILSAPFHSTEAEDNENECPSDKTLALGYANRSAILYVMEQFDLCLRDIKAALTYGYPKDRRHRLFERQAKCLWAVGRSQEAKALLQEVIVNIENIPSTKDQQLLLKQKLQTTLRTFQDSPVPRDVKELFKNEHAPLFYTGPPAAPLVEKPGNKAEHLSEAISVEYSQEKGRHLVATRDIFPGEVLLSEVAYASEVLHDSTLRMYCYHCLRRAPVPFPCPSCSLVVFCSEFCLKEELKSNGNHRIICSLLPSVVALKLDVDALLTFKILSSKTLNKLKEESAAFKEGVPSTEKNAISYEYKSLMKLEGHAEKRSSDSIIEAICEAIVVIELLLKCPGFLDETQAKDGRPSINTDELILISSHVLRLIFQVQCNAHCIKELNISAGQRVTSANAAVRGHGIYCALSLVNHSCFPNAMHSSLGNTKFMYSVSFIGKGAEINECYGERYVSHSLEERRKTLEETYFFKCGCIACRDDWPLFTHLPANFLLRCIKCDGSLNMSSFCCTKCHEDYRSESKVNARKKGKRKSKGYCDGGGKGQNPGYDAPKMREEIQHVWEENNKMETDLRNFRSSKFHIEKVSKLLFLMDKYALQPNKIYNEAQETLLRLYDLMSSVKYDAKET